MPADVDVPVLIVGAGPVGLTLAADLAVRGVGCLVVESRTGTTEHPKATLLGARSMELFRRWGLDEEIEAAALPAEQDYHIVFTTRLADEELFRFTNPSVAAVRRRDPPAVARYRELAWSPYLKTQIGQQALEPILRRFVTGRAECDVRYGSTLESFTDQGERVLATVTAEDGRPRTVAAQYLVGCDGGNSTVRRQLGVSYAGRGPMRRNVSYYFHAPDLLELHGKGLANLYFTFAPDSFGVFTSIDGRTRWNYQHYFLDPGSSTRDLEPSEVISAAVGRPVLIELLATQHWRHHQSVAMRWRAGRVLLAGDAAHLFVPTGGVGMNTGIGDAADLAWKLAAEIQGWGGVSLLDSYEAERKPVAIRNSLISANNSDKIDMVMQETPSTIVDRGPEGSRARAELKKKLRWLAHQFSSAGVHLGYRYVDSPICVPDGSPAPPDDPSQVVPSTWPGSRVPHVWLADGRSSLDLWGPGYTLVRDSGAPELGDVVEAAVRAGLPLRRLELPPVEEPLLESRYLLVRPDGHAAWRGDAAPQDADALIARVRGALTG